MRSAYLQRRRSLIYDGNAPREADPDKASESGQSNDGAARAETELPRAPVTTELGERVVSAVDAELAPAREITEARPMPVAAAPEAAGDAGSVYEPKIPFNHDALLADSDEVRTELARAAPTP